MGQSWTKAHDSSKNTFWENYPSIASPIIDTELNRNEVSVDTVDDRVITLDTTKAEQSDLLQAFKDVSLDSTTGVITFTLFNNTTKTIDTLLEKIAINFDYDDNPSSPHYQNLVIELEDGTYKYIDMSALITQYEFTNSSCISWTIGNDGSVTANIIDGSITGAKLQPNYLADCLSAKSGAENAEADAIAKALVAEGYANGKQNGVPVTSGSPYYENNAEYFKDQASSIVGSKVDSFNGRTGVVTSQTGDYNQSQISVPTGATEGQVPIVRSGVFAMELPPTGVTVPQALDFIGKKTHFDSDISCVADIYESKTEFNSNGSITERLRYNGKNLAISATATNTLGQYYTACFAEIDNFTPSTTYTFSFVGTNGNKIYPNENVFTSSAGFTIASGRTTVTLTTKSELPSNQYNPSQGGWNLFKNSIAQSNANVFNDFQVEVGSTATSYEPYYNNVKTTHFMGNDIIEDLHDYQGCVDLGSLTWTYNNEHQFFKSVEVLNDFNYISDSIINYHCNKYLPIKVIERYIDKTIFVNSQKMVVIQDLAYTDVTAFKNANNGVYLTYELATQ